MTTMLHALTDLTAGITFGTVIYSASVTAAAGIATLARSERRRSAALRVLKVLVRQRRT